MEPLDIVDTQNDTPAPGRKLNATVAITVALLATFMGICKVKDDNINQSMQQAQANRSTTGPSTRPATCARKWPSPPWCS